MSQELRSWGVTWSPDIKYSPNYRCPNCDESYMSDRRREEYIIGFSVDQPFVSSQMINTVIGILIIECPGCFSKFWFHLIDLQLDRCVRLCPRWPLQQP